MKKEFFNIIKLTEAWRAVSPPGGLDHPKWSEAAALAQAQQLSVISKHLERIATALETICNVKGEGR